MPQQRLVSTLLSSKTLTHPKTLSLKDLEALTFFLACSTYAEALVRWAWSPPPDVAWSLEGFSDSWRDRLEKVTEPVSDPEAESASMMAWSQTQFQSDLVTPKTVLWSMLHSNATKLFSKFQVLALHCVFSFLARLLIYSPLSSSDPGHLFFYSAVAFNKIERAAASLFLFFPLSGRHSVQD